MKNDKEYVGTEARQGQIVGAVLSRNDRLTIWISTKDKQ